MSRVLPILQVDAFTARPFSGNPAGDTLGGLLPVTVSASPGGIE